MLFVMANRDDAYAIRKNPVKEVIWEPLQVRPAQITKGRMKPQRVFRGGFDVSV